MGEFNDSRYEIIFSRPIADQKGEGVLEAEIKLSSLALDTAIARRNAEERFKGVTGQ